MIETIIETISQIALTAARWAREGLSDEEIRERLARPAEVGQDILERIDDRKKRGEELLGKDRD